MVRKQTLRLFGRYAGKFHNKYRQCFNLVIKVAESAVEEDATELSEKLVFMLSRLIFFQARVEGSTTINDILKQRADMFLRGEWEQLYDQFVQEENRERGGRTRKISLAVQRKRAAKLMEEGLVRQSVTMLGESRIVPG